MRSRKHVCLLLAITCVVHFLQRCFSFAWHCLGSCIHTTNAHSSKAAFILCKALLLAAQLLSVRTMVTTGMAEEVTNPWKVMIQGVWSSITREAIEEKLDEMGVPRPDVHLFIVLRGILYTDDRSTFHTFIVLSLYRRVASLRRYPTQNICTHQPPHVHPHHVVLELVCPPGLSINMCTT